MASSVAFATTHLPFRLAPSAPTADRPHLRACAQRPRTERECVHDFITQRAVQQTAFCALQLRDETTANWLEAFLGHGGIHDLHACDALRVPSEEYLYKLFRAPPETVRVHKPIPGRTTRQNPYLKRRYFSYDVDIVPKNIARRVLASRGQIAEELLEDLECMSSENARLSGERLRSLLSRTTPSPALDLPPTYERGGSPYRAATYDLASNYTLAQALARAAVGQVFDADKKNGTSTGADDDGDRWMEGWGESERRWARKVSGKLRDGLMRPAGGERGEADRAVRTLFEEVPVVSASGGWLDTVRLAEEVLRGREACAAAWRNVLREVPEQHLALERDALEDLL